MLSITDCAAQFELYAASHETVADKHAARHLQFVDDTTAEGHTARLYETHNAAVRREAAHQLRFCAQFLRQQAVLWWTSDLSAGALLDAPGHGLSGAPLCGVGMRDQRTGWRPRPRATGIEARARAGSLCRSPVGRTVAAARRA